MFTKILIANRGEIACRVIKTARDMGIGTVAVYSDADANAKHVAMADEAVHIGGAAAADSYLSGERIIAAALQTGAGAVHPGYGFLSENPEFVEAVEKAGLVFIGPSADAIRAMGLKDKAKILMEKAGVPVVPGYHGADQDDGVLSAAAAKIGFPVLIKAVAGGGGKGMRRVDGPAEFAEALRAARREGLSSFANDAVLVEKYISAPRHIEIQIFGDDHGRVVHLFERDCSLQRRHQKVIEEAPAPGMTKEMRDAMGTAAVQAAKAIGYSGAGTVEFIVDGAGGLRPGGFWFMEMNTRLQVEHPVTEAVTGIDLVEWQLRVAAGDPLPLAQDELTLNGHAFEARLYAEDVPAGFLPATGKLDHLAFPAQIRADSGVRTGDVISPFYDPMIAKLITHGPTRDIALARMTLALEETEVAGSVTNLAFLTRLTRHRGFAAGAVDTGLIERDLAALTAAEAIPGAVLALAAIGAAGLDKAHGWQTGFSIWSPMAQDVAFLADEKRIEARITTLAAGVFEVVVQEDNFACEMQNGWRVNGVKTGARIFRHGAGLSIFAKMNYSFELIDPLARESAAGAGGNVIVAPMPGLVKSVFVVAGDRVEKGARLAVLEAMKMEHQLAAARDGVVAEVLVIEGAQVENGVALVRLENEEDET